MKVSCALVHVKADTPMARRLVSILGILAMLIAFVPAIVNAGSSSNLCCDGVMCPFHHLAEADCDAAHSRDGALQSCPGHGARFTGALPFARVAPAVSFELLTVDFTRPIATPSVVPTHAEVPYPPPELLTQISAK